MADDAATVPDNFIVLEWGDGEYQFRLPAGQIGELQTKCGAGIGKIFARLMAGRSVDRLGNIVLNPLECEFRYEDIAEPIRLGLIGGGGGTVDGKPVDVTPTKALQLVRNYVHPRPLLENWKVAAAILNAYVVGYTDPDKAEKKSDSTQNETDDQGWFHLDIMLANCAAMGISPREARDLTLWEYEATLVQWNYAHDTDPQPEPATAEDFMASEQFFADHPQLLH